MHSSTSNSDFVRTVPDLPWRGISFFVVALLSTAATGCVGEYPRPFGGLCSDAQRQRLTCGRRLGATGKTRFARADRVHSRMLFDVDLDLCLSRGLVKRPTQLAVLWQVHQFPNYWRTSHSRNKNLLRYVLLDVVPAMYLAPGGPTRGSVRKKRYDAIAPGITPNAGAIKLGHAAGRQGGAFLKQEDLTLSKLLEKLPIPNRANAMVGPRMPPYFYTLDADRRARMAPEAAVVGRPLATARRERLGWPLFSVPPPPSFIPVEHFQKMMGQAGMETRFR